MREAIWEAYYEQVRELTLADGDYAQAYEEWLADTAGEDGFYGPNSPADWEDTGHYEAWVREMIAILGEPWQD